MSIRKFILAAALLLPLALPVAAHANDLKIAVVDVSKVLSDSKAAQSIQKQIDDQRAVLKSDLEKQQETLKKEEADILKLRSEPPTDEFKKKAQDFQKKLNDAQQTLGGRKQNLDKAAGTAIDTLKKEIVAVVGEISSKEKYDLVLTRQDVVTVNAALDITDSVIKSLDKKVSKIDVKAASN